MKICAIDNTYRTENHKNKTNRICFKKITSRLEKYGKVAYVDVVNDSDVYVRFSTSSSAQKAILEERELALNLLTGKKKIVFEVVMINLRS